MNAFRICVGMAGRLVSLGFVALWLWSGSALAGVEERFDVLQIGTKTYKNVTVTTKARDYIFILHSTGMTNIKVTDLPPELRNQLGYVEKPKPEPKSVAYMAKLDLAKFQIPQLSKALNAVGGVPRLKALGLQTLLIGFGALFALFLLFCYCSKLICEKTGHPAGPLVWMPVLQLIPLLRAANMSLWWFLAFLIPVLNLVAQIVWSFKIVQARAKSLGIAILLLLPLTNVFAYLYLALSTAAPRKEEKVVEIMTLDAA